MANTVLLIRAPVLLTSSHQILFGYVIPPHAAAGHTACTLAVKMVHFLSASFQHKPPHIDRPKRYRLEAAETCAPACPHARALEYSPIEFWGIGWRWLRMWPEE